jgi:spore maturation protein CgeB
MLSRAAVVTDDSDYIHREFTDGRELAVFELNDIGSLPEKVFDLFGHMNRTQEMADRGYEAAKARHTWAARAEAIEAAFLHAAC